MKSAMEGCTVASLSMQTSCQSVSLYSGPWKKRNCISSAETLSTPIARILCTQWKTSKKWSLVTVGVARRR